MVSLTLSKCSSLNYILALWLWLVHPLSNNYNNGYNQSVSLWAGRHRDTGICGHLHDTRAEVWRVVWQGKKVAKWGEI